MKYDNFLSIGNENNDIHKNLTRNKKVSDFSNDFKNIKNTKCSKTIIN